MLPVVDPNSITETFVTSVIQAGLISGGSVAVTLGMRRYLQPDIGAEPEETLCIASRLVLTLDAAQNLVEAVSAMLSRAKTDGEPITFETAKWTSVNSH